MISIIITLHSHKFSGDLIPDIEFTAKIDKRLCPVHNLLNYAKIRPNKGLHLFVDEQGKCIRRSHFAKMLSFASTKFWTRSITVHIVYVWGQLRIWRNQELLSLKLSYKADGIHMPL